MTDQVFLSGSGRAKVVVWLFIAGIVTALLSIGSDIAEIELLQRIGGGGNWTMAEAEANDLRTAVIATLDGLVIAAGMIAFLIWLHRVRANLPALGIEDARWTPGWAVGWWFVPVWWWFRPFQVVKEIWKASAPEARPNSWRDASTPALLGWWWALYILGMFASNIAFRKSMSGPETADEFIASSMAYIVSEGLWVIATIPAIMVVKGIDRRQTERHDALIQGAPTEVHATPD